MNTEAWRVVLRESQDRLEAARAYQEKLQRDWDENAAKIADLDSLVETVSRQLDDAPRSAPQRPIHEAVEAMLRQEPDLTRDQVIEKLAINYKEFRGLADKKMRVSASLYMSYARQRLGDAQTDGDTTPLSEWGSESGMERG